MKKAQIKKLRQTVKNRQKKPGFFGYVISKLKTYLFTGILVTMPVTITFYMAYELFVWMDKWTRSLIPPQVAAHEFVPYIPGIGVADCCAHSHRYVHHRFYRQVFRPSRRLHRL